MNNRFDITPSEQDAKSEGEKPEIVTPEGNKI